MPKYKNITTSSKIVGGISIKPGHEEESPVWSTDAGLEKLSDFPMYNSVLFSKNICDDEIIDIPSAEKRISVHIFVEGVAVEVRLSSDKNEPALNLYHSARWNMRFYDGVVKDIRIKFNPETVQRKSVWITIERI